MANIPPGFRFAPSDEQLISYFLERKVRGIAIPQACPILERKLYGTNATPWNVLSDDDPCWEDSDNPNKRIITVFTELNFTSEATKNRVARTAGCGTWGGKAVTQNVKNRRGEVIGHKKAFTFKPHERHKSEANGKGHWIMHEFSLVAARRSSNGEYVICRISKDFSKDESQTTTTTKDESQTTTTTDSNVSSTTMASSTVETSRKRKSPSSPSCVSYDPYHLLTQKKTCCTGVHEDEPSLESTTPYLAMLNQEITSHGSSESCNVLNIDNAEQLKRRPDGIQGGDHLNEQVIPYSSQPLPGSLFVDHLMHQQRDFAPAPLGAINGDNIDEAFWTSDAADVLGADFVI